MEKTNACWGERVKGKPQLMVERAVRGESVHRGLQSDVTSTAELTASVLN